MGQPPAPPVTTGDFSSKIETFLKRNLKYPNIKKSGNFIIVVVEIPQGQKNIGFRVDTMKKIAAEINNQFPGLAEYNPTQSLKSSIGFIEFSGSQTKIIVKDAKKQGEKRAGVANEHELVNLIKKQIKQYGKVDVVFQDDRGTRLEAPGVTDVVASGTDTKDRKKADVVLISPELNVPVSIKQTDAQAWESADSLFGARAKVLLNKLSSDGVVKLDKINQIQVKGQLLPVYKLDKEIVVKPTTQDSLSAIFGSDINPAGGIIVQDFMPHHFIQFDDTIIIDCYAVIKTEADIPESHLMYFLIKNMPGRASLGYYGIGTQAVTMTRAFGKGLTKNPIFVDQAGNVIPKPPPRNPAV
jgi:hypothetical protein